MEDHTGGERQAEHTPKSPILWQNPSQTVTLLDIPHSISAAQEHASPLELLSSSPIKAPFPSNEPKSASAKAKLVRNTVDAELHAEYERLLNTALGEVGSNFEGLWCLARGFCEKQERPAKKRMLGQRAEEGVVKCPQLLAENPESSSTTTPVIQHTENSFTNDTDAIIRLQRSSGSNESSQTFYIPPGASFSLGDCADSHAFHAAVRAEAKRSHSRRDFDFVLLDPPWPNRSVKRTYQTPGSTYSISPSLLDLRELVLDMRLDSLVAEEGLVGVWTTNKAAAKDLVLGEDGLFAHWGVQLVEEWIWLKTSISGEPVTALDALWRKPYEVLLLGRKRRKGSTEGTSMRDDSGEEAPKLKRRVIVAVPDLHSRKPCLKDLIEPLMPDPSKYRALEVFARHLVGGWWSWGDECVKFNWEGYWRDAAEKNV